MVPRQPRYTQGKVGAEGHTRVDIEGICPCKARCDEFANTQLASNALSLGTRTPSGNYVVSLRKCGRVVFSIIVSAAYLADDVVPDDRRVAIRLLVVDPCVIKLPVVSYETTIMDTKGEGVTDGQGNSTIS